MTKYIIAVIAALGLSASAHAAGYDTAEIGVSSGTNAVIVTSTPGSTLYRLVISSGAQGDYAVCWDSAATAGSVSQFDTTADSSAQQGKRIAFAIVNTAVYTSPQDPPAGDNRTSLNIVNGLVCKKSAAAGRIRVNYSAGR